MCTIGWITFRTSKHNSASWQRFISFSSTSVRASISAMEGFLLPQNLLGFDILSASLFTVVGDEFAVDLGLAISVSL